MGFSTFILVLLRTECVPLIHSSFFNLNEILHLFHRQNNCVLCLPMNYTAIKLEQEMEELGCICTCKLVQLLESCGFFFTLVLQSTPQLIFTSDLA